MPYKIKFTPESEQDLDNIAAYLAEYSDITPLAVIAEIRKNTDLLEKMPRLFPVCEEDQRLRKIVVGDYIVLYSLNDGKRTANIEFVYHGSRDIKRVLTRQEPFSKEADFEIGEEEEELEF